MSSTKAKRKHRNRAQRYTSNVFAMFSQEQIQEFKEAFNVIDQNRDGFVDKDDLLEMLTSLGKNPTDEFLDNMIREAPGPLNFTMFLTLFGEKLNGTDPEDVIRNAFACFDPDDYGFLQEDYLKELMTTMGDRWTEEQVEDLFQGAPIKHGFFDYRQFTRALKHGSDRDEDHKDCPNLPPGPVQMPQSPDAVKPAAAPHEEPKLPPDPTKPILETPRSRRKSLTKPPEKSLEEEFLMRKFSLAASFSTYSKPEEPIAKRKLSVPTKAPESKPAVPRKFSETTAPQISDLEKPLSRRVKDTKQAGSNPELKTLPELKPLAQPKPAAPASKPAPKDPKKILKTVPKSALKKT